MRIWPFVLRSELERERRQVAWLYQRLERESITAVQIREAVRGGMLAARPSGRVPKPYDIFTKEHHDAIGRACEKLWNGMPVEDPIYGPRGPHHPLVRIANKALAALNAVEAMRVAFLQENQRLRNRIRTLEARGAKRGAR